MEMKPAMVAIAAFVVITVIAAVLMPVLGDATKTEDTFTNTGVFDYQILSSTDTYSFAYDHSAQDGKITVNGTEMTVPAIGPSYSNSFSIIYDDDWLIRMSWSVSQGGYYCQIVGKDVNDTTFRYGGSITGVINNGNFDVTIDQGNGTPISKTMPINKMYAIVPTNDDAVLKVSTASVYILGDTDLSMSGLTAIANWYDVIHIEGSYDDGLTITSPNLAGVTFDNVEWNITEVNSHIDLYKLTSIEFDAHYNGNTQHVTYSYFGVPSEVTAERSVHFSANENAILLAIPALAIVAIIIGVLALAFRNRE